MGAAEVKAGLVATLTTAFASDTLVLVSSGDPGSTAVPDLVAVTDMTSAADGDEQVYRLTVIVSAYIGGAQEAQALATARASSLVDSIRTAVYNAPTLGGAARVAALDEDFTFAEAAATANGVAVGRVAEITCRVVAWSGRLTLGSLSSAHRVP